MKQTEFKFYDVKLSHELHWSMGSVDKFTPDDPKGWTRAIVQRHGIPIPLGTTATLIENWNHKVGRKWTMTKTVIGEWSVDELMAEAGADAAIGSKP